MQTGKLIASVLKRGRGDTIAPTVAITSTETSPSVVLPVPIAFALSEISTDFAVGGLTLNGCTVANFAGSGTSYTCEATPTANNGAFTIDIAANAFHDAAGNGNVAATQFSFTSSTFLLLDDFTTNLGAGSVNGTTAEPGGTGTAGQKTRTVTDTGSKLSIASNAAAVAGLTVSAADPRLFYGTVARLAGRTLFAKMTAASDASAYIGYGSVATASPQANGTKFQIGNLSIMNGPIGGAYTQGTEYQIAVVLRNTGAFSFIKGGSQYTNWTLLYDVNQNNNADMYPGFGIGNNPGTMVVDDFHVTSGRVAITPIVSDAFTRADGALGNTGGGGSEESGGTGFAWTSQLGTWGIATNKAASSALDGTANISIATVNAGATNVLIEVVATRSAGTSGLIVRYTDANNYIKCIHNGTNLQVIEVVAGTPNTLINAATTYGATKRMFLSLSANKLRAYYGEGSVGSEVTTAVTAGNLHGIFTDDTGATFDNFVIWSKGLEGQYATAMSHFFNSGSLPPPMILINFDDNRASLYSTAFPYMQSKGVVGTVYEITSNAASEAAHLLEMQAAGWVVGNHAHHQDLQALSEADQEAALLEGYNDLLNIGITTGKHVCYPMGYYNADTLTAMTATGMLTGRTTNYGSVFLSNLVPYEIKSIQPASLDEAKSLMDTAVSGRRIQVLLFHESPAYLTDMIDYIVAQHYPCGTIADLYALL
jgi:peptidoglycan/xylan/chitin deacetylase (PgdA/CDA1 family)